MRVSTVLVVGDVMEDILVVPEGPLVRGSDRRATIRSRPGGSGANQAVWLAATGVPVRFAARVAEHDRTRQEAHFRSWGVEPVLAADREAAPGRLIAIVDADGERSFLTDRGANLNLSPADLPLRLLDDAGYLLISGYALFAPGPRKAVLGLVHQARERGVATAIDPASVGFLREVGIAAFLGWTGGMGTVFANEEEAAVLSGTADVDGQMRALGRSYDRVVVKRGAAGAALGGLNGVLLELPAPKRDVVDTTGAGDAFAAGFLAAELRGESAQGCLAAGVAAGSDAVTRLGAGPPEPLSP